MSLTLYAIGDGQPASELAFAGARLKTVAADGLVMFVAERPTPDAGADAEELWRYERVMEQLMEQRTVLPARYGTVLADEQAARDALRERRDELERRLSEVHGAVELAVRATWNDPRQSASESSSGREYMLGRLRDRREAQRIATLLEPLRSLARRSVIRLLPGPGIVLLGSYLVERARVASFDECFHSLIAKAEGATVSCTGPWPPYSFAEGGVD